MSNLQNALKKFDNKTSSEALIEALQNGSEIYYLSHQEFSSFQEYIIGLLNNKSSKELSLSLNDLNKKISDFNLSSTKSAKVLNFLTGVLALATLALVFVTIASIYIK